jgi:glycosyltransferase involved in cell wall biosynthesis
MINVLGLALYGAKAASTRHRLLQYIPELSKHGINLEVHFLLNDAYIKSKNEGAKLDRVNLLKTSLERLNVIINQRKYQCAIVHCEIFPLLPGFIESRLLHIPYIYDFDDAFYIKYFSRRFRILKPFLGRKFDSIIQNAEIVNAGNNELFSYAKKLNYNTNLLPTVIDSNRYFNKSRKLDDVFTIGWIGSPSTAKYLNLVVPILSEICSNKKIRVRLIGSGPFDIPGVDIDVIPWSEDNEVELLHTFDVGIMPLFDTPWERGKCGFKLIQYMACSIPVIASPVGVNCKIIEHEKNGFLASTSEEWKAALLTLMHDPKLGEKMGKEGKKIVEEKYSVTSALPNLVESVMKVSNRK